VSENDRKSTIKETVVRLEDLACALAGLQEKGALKIVEESLRAGVNPTSVLEEARKAMERGSFFCR